MASGQGPSPPRPPAQRKRRCSAILEDSEEDSSTQVPPHLPVVRDGDSPTRRVSPDHPSGRNSPDNDEQSSGRRQEEFLEPSPSSDRSENAVAPSDELSLSSTGLPPLSSGFFRPIAATLHPVESHNLPSESARQGFVFPAFIDIPNRRRRVRNSVFPRTRRRLVFPEGSDAAVDEDIDEDAGSDAESDRGSLDAQPPTPGAWDVSPDSPSGAGVEAHENDTQDNEEDDTFVGGASSYYSPEEMDRVCPIAVLEEDDSGRDTCCICLEEMTHGQVIRTLPCGHRNHRMCIDTWMEGRSACPMCRTSIV